MVVTVESFAALVIVIEVPEFDVEIGGGGYDVLAVDVVVYAVYGI